MTNFALVKSDGGIAAIVTNLPDAKLSAFKLPDALPDRYFRDAWIVRGDMVAIDMPRAREIWRRRMRTAAEARFPWLDDAQRDELARVVREANLDAADTPEGLRRIWPEQLGPNNA